MKEEMAILAGGCFWGMEEILRKIPGIIDTEVGYTGGTTNEANYNLVKTGTTGHAEAVQLIFEPAVITYKEILNYFFKMHDPTTPNQQGNDKGTQYRSAIFYTNENQKELALNIIAEKNKLKQWALPIVTEVIPFQKFFNAEAFHQDYLKKNPQGYTCHWLREE